MTQPSLFKPERQRKSNIAKCDQFDAANLRTAREFIEDPALCGGLDSFGMQWAHAVVERLEPDLGRAGQERADGA